MLVCPQQQLQRQTQQENWVGARAPSDRPPAAPPPAPASTCCRPHSLGVHLPSRLVLSEEDAAVVPAKPKRVGQNHVHISLLLLPADQHAEVDARLGVVQVQVGVQPA
jgi:hypothetical protein